MDYLQPQNLKSALQLMQRWKGRAVLVAGGTNVVPDLRVTPVQPKALLDISRLKSLSCIKEDGKKIRIGALTTISELVSSEVIRKGASVLFHACQQLGNPLVRNRATIAGNLADASPATDTAVPLLVLDAQVVAVKDGGRSRHIPVDRFFLGPNLTVLKRDEMIQEVIIPKFNTGAKTAYFKLGLRNSMAVSVISIALLIEMEKGYCKKARIAYGAVAPTPIRVYRIEEMLENQKLTEDLLEACCEAVGKEVHPISDIRASKEYRTEMASVLLRRLIREITSQPSV
jgi:carbon-monoxide dehydrogenase medium subunit